VTIGPARRTRVGSFADLGPIPGPPRSDFGDGRGPHPLASIPDKTFVLNHTIFPAGLVSDCRLREDKDGAVAGVVHGPVGAPPSLFRPGRHVARSRTISSAPARRPRRRQDGHPFSAPSIDAATTWRVPPPFGQVKKATPRTQECPLSRPSTMRWHTHLSRPEGQAQPEAARAAQDHRIVLTDSSVVPSTATHDGSPAATLSDPERKVSPWPRQVSQEGFDSQRFSRPLTALATCTVVAKPVGPFTPA